MTKALILTCIGLLVLCSVGFADIPKMINYQGMLTESGGSTPVPDGDYNLGFKIYGSESGSDSLWWEYHSSVEVAHGLFNVILGSETVLNLSFDTDYWLEIKVEGEVMPQRLRFTSVGYAYRAQVADSAVVAGSGGGSNWSVADSVLYTNSYWGIARGGAGNVFYGDSVHTMVNLGVACTTGQSGENFYYSSVNGGYGNAVSWYFSTVAGGRKNRALSTGSTVGGGTDNLAIGDRSVVAGGYQNAARGFMSAVGGGYQDTARAVYAGVFSGYSNFAGDEVTDTAAFVGGGYDNTVADKYGTVAGGYDNTAIGWYATVSGGYSGTANNTYATIGGGRDNSAAGDASTVGGGGENSADGDYGTVAGGFDNHAGAYCSSILGGHGNNITNTASYSSLFGIESQLTQDSTFMVDMPHIRFGDETNGYEFPTSDGSSGQVLATDGSGQLSWTGAASGGGWTDDGTVVRLTTSTDSVGIGTTSPTAKLDINGDININSDYKIGGNTVVSVSGTANILAGVGAGENNTGSYATCVGYQAGNTNAGEHNTFIGRRAGYVNAAGYRNTFLGSGAGRFHTGGHRNTFVGYGSGYQSTTGNYNTFFGYEAGYHCTTGVQNVFIGYQAGYNEIGSNKLYIANGSGASDVLIYGDFLSGEVGIGTTSPDCELDVDGDVNVTGTINECRSQFVRVNTTNSGEYIFDDDWYNNNRPEIRTTGTTGEIYIDNNGGVQLNFVIKEDGVVVVSTSGDNYTHTASDGKLLEIYVWPYTFIYQWFVHFTGAREGDYIAGMVKGGSG